MSRRAKLLVSGLLIFHLTAMLICPLATPPSSRLFGSLWAKMQWYTEPLYMNHGYRFFAPDPGPSHLVRYEIELPDGETLEGELPNLEQNWPRLLYHRHFMLTERLGNGPLESPAMQALVRSYAQHLFALHHAQRVKLYLKRHLIPFPEQIAEGMKLNDSSLYQEELLIDYTGEAGLEEVPATPGDSAEKPAEPGSSRPDVPSRSNLCQHRETVKSTTSTESTQPTLRELGGNYLAQWREFPRFWDRFWFTPTDVSTYCLIRVLAGAMLFYTHLVWTIDLDAFFGPTPWVTNAAMEARNGALQIGQYAWSYYWWIDSPSMVWTMHIIGLVILAMFTVGFYSRITSVLSMLILVSYTNRVPDAQYGLDQIDALLTLYLCVGPSGAMYSVDRWLAKRKAARAGVEAPIQPSIGANVGIRLIQLHMCVIYLFAGIGKMAGTTWADGTAMWGAVANLEYQSLDLTWLATWPIIINILTHITTWWELTYSALVWPRLTRPIVVALSIPLHLGIAIFLGMITFGLAMLIGNAAFVSPQFVNACDALVRRQFARFCKRPAPESAPSPASRRKQKQAVA